MLVGSILHTAFRSTISNAFKFNLMLIMFHHLCTINYRASLYIINFQYVVSGLKVSRLDMYGEKYKPFKGVKYVTKAGRFQVRM